MRKDAESLVDVLVSGMFNGDERMWQPVQEFLRWTNDHLVLWLIVGMDEVDLKEGTTLWKIQKGKPLDEGQVVFMMAEASKNWLHFEKDSILAVKGLADEGIWRFVRGHFKEWNGYDAALTLLICMKRVYKGWMRDLQRKIAEPLLSVQVAEGGLTRLVGAC